MAGSFKISEEPLIAVRRICNERIKFARRKLPHTGQADAVHAVRKEIKKLRALIDLVREDMDRSAYRQAKKSLRWVADTLAVSRDARVILNAFDDLARSKSHQFSPIRKHLRERCRHALRQLAKRDFSGRADERLRNVKRHLCCLKQPNSGWMTIQAGVARSYQRGRQCFHQVVDNPSAENLHAWRKAVKQIENQLRLICPKWPQKIAETEQALARLGGNARD